MAHSIHNLAARPGRAPDYRLFFNASPAPLLVINPDWTIAAANDALLAVSGKPREEMLGRSWFEVFPDDPSDPNATGVRDLRASLERAVRTRKPDRMASQRYSVRVGGADSNQFEERYWSALNIPVFDESGELVCVLHQTEDITDAVRARNNLLASEQRLKLAIEATGIGVWQIESTTKDLWRTPSHDHAYGLEYEESRTPEFFINRIAPEDREQVRTELARSLKSGARFTTDYRVLWPDGSVHWLSVDGRSLPDPTGRFSVIGTISDVTARKESERALRESEARFRESVESLEQERELRESFVATLSHDLRTPLTAAKMSAQILVRRGSGPELTNKLVPRITENIDRADKMIRDLLDANRINAGEKLPIEVGPCDLRKLTEDTLEELATVYGDRFILEAPGAVEGNWSCEALRRMLDNLCSNAVKYGAKDRTISVRIRERKQEVELDVHNHGTPIPQDEADHLFDLYRRSLSAHAGEQKGWGLGLTLVKGLADAHGGRVEVESSKEAGTTFTVILPREAPKGNGSNQHSHRVADPTRSSGTGISRSSDPSS